MWKLQGVVVPMEFLKGPNKAFMQHILRNGVAPRRLKGAFLIPRKTALFLFYMNNSGCPKSFWYSNPQFGGQMGGITIEFMKKYDFFAAFAESKIWCALILQQSHPQVVPFAVADQLSSLHEVMESLHIAGANNTLITSKHVLPMFSTQFKFTLVLHTYGCHVDNFSNKQSDAEPSSSLEN